MTAEPRGGNAPWLSGVLLAAGSARRLGRPKQLLPLAGRPLLQHALDAAAASQLDEIVVVLGHAAAEVRAALALPSGRAVSLIDVGDGAAGQGASLVAGLRAAHPRADAAAVLLGDQPGVTAALIDAVAAAFRAAGRPVARPVYVDAAGRRTPGHPVFLARRIWGELADERGDRGARAWIAAHSDAVHELPIEGPPPVDVDVWEDYLRLRDAARG